MRLAYVTQWFPPEAVGPPLWIARALRDRGCDVVVATGIPNYPTGVVSPGYRARQHVVEVREGFKVLRSPLYPSHDGSASGRILNYLSFAATSTWYASPALRSADVSLVYASPATAAWPAMIAKRRFGTPYVLYVQDLWPDSIFATGFFQKPFASEMAQRFLEPYLRAMYAEASEIAVITPGMKDALVSRGVEPDRVSVVYNWVDEDIIRPASPNGRLRQMIGAAEHDIVLLYAGNQGKAQALRAWIEAMGRVRDLTDIRLVLIGDGTERKDLEAQRASLRLGSVHFLNPVPEAQMASLAADADALVISLSDHPLFRITMPGKTQACLAQGKPVVASALGDVARAVQESGAGWTAQPEDPSSIAGAIRQVREAGPDELERRGRLALSYYTRHMARRVGAARLHRLLQSAVTMDAGS